MRIGNMTVGLAMLAAGTVAAQAATVGFVQDFNSGLGGFGGGSPVTLHAGGGVGGAGDGYLEVYELSPAQLGVRSTAAELTGDLTADGVTGFSFWLQDVGEDEDLEIHVGVGEAFNNFWLNVNGFAPGDGGWEMFSVDITDESDWVQIIGGGTFAEALASSNRLLFRHDMEPFEQFPDFAAGDFGLDRITVLPEPATALMLALPAVAALRRRR